MYICIVVYICIYMYICIQHTGCASEKTCYRALYFRKRALYLRKTASRYVAVCYHCACFNTRKTPLYIGRYFCGDHTCTHLRTLLIMYSLNIG